VVVGLVLLVLIALPLLPRLRGLLTAADALKTRADEAQALQAQLLALQQRADDVQRAVAHAQQRVTTLRGSRSASSDT
jgi:hypothetical protein